MKTLEQWIEFHKKADPVIKEGNDQDGYTEYDAERYEATILKWAQNSLEQEQNVADEKAKRDSALAKLQALGLDEDDLKALGL